VDGEDRSVASESDFRSVEMIQGCFSARLLPSWQHPFPIWIDMFAHFGFVIALAIAAFFVAFATACKLIVVQLDAEAGFIRNADAAVHDGNTTAKDDFVLR